MDMTLSQAMSIADKVKCSCVCSQYSQALVLLKEEINKLNNITIVNSKFKVGQTWKDREGGLWEIIEIRKNSINTYFVFPILAMSGCRAATYTLTGKFEKGHDSPVDLIGLISEV